MADKSLTEPDLSSPTAALIERLAEVSSEPTMLGINTKGLGDGLPENIPILFDRRNQRVIGLKDAIESHRQAPLRRRGTAKVETLKSFVELVNRHKDAYSAIFAATSWPNPSLTAIINYHAGATPRWGDHRIQYAFPLTEEFKAWIDSDKKAFDQTDFAAFLEEHAAELSAPFDGERSEYEALFKERLATPSEVVALSRSLEVHVGAKAKQGIRLQSGERQIEFVEEHMNSNGEKIDIPGIFMVSVAAFLSGDPVRIPARLRYRIAGGTIVWFYQLYRWEFWLRDAVQQALREAGKECELPTFEGAPEPVA